MKLVRYLLNFQKWSPSSLHSNNEIIYLPKNTVKAIHLTSANTAAQVIHALLAKFKIANDARKYVLCERKERDRGHVTLRF